MTCKSVCRSMRSPESDPSNRTVTWASLRMTDVYRLNRVPPAGRNRRLLIRPACLLDPLCQAEHD